MALYSIGVRTAAAATGAAFADLKSTATDRLFVREIHVYVASAVVLTVGLTRPNALGTQTTPVLGQAEDPADPAATGLTAVAWSVAPTVIATPIYLRRFDAPATIGNGIIWTFGGRGLVVPVSSSLLLWNIGAGAGPLLDVVFVWEE